MTSKCMLCFFAFSTVCECFLAGTVGESCAEVGGACTCKNNTEGAFCHLCTATSYNYGSDDGEGCQGKCDVVHDSP